MGFGRVLEELREKKKKKKFFFETTEREFLEKSLNCLFLERKYFRVVICFSHAISSIALLYLYLFF